VSGDQPVPLAGVCLGRTMPIEYVYALVRAGILPPPDGADELVPRGYLAAVDPDPLPELRAGEWRDHLVRELRRFRDGRTRLLDASSPGDGRRRDQQLMRIGSAAWGVALALSMEHHRDEARVWLDRAATFYRRSLADAEAGSWGRSIGALKARTLADDVAGAVREARWTLGLGAAAAESTTARYAACLALLTLGRDEEAVVHARLLVDEETFPAATSRGLVALATGDAGAYGEAVGAVLETFETRPRFLEDIPVADTVLTLQILARVRGLGVELRSARLPGDS
jgi:hypothetical protein